MKGLPNKRSTGAARKVLATHELRLDEEGTGVESKASYRTEGAIIAK